MTPSTRCVEPQSGERSFQVHPCQVPFTIKRTLLSHLARALLDSDNADVSKLGYSCGHIAAHPQERDEIRDGRTPSLYTIANITNQSVTIYLDSSLLRFVGIALKTSENRAVACFGYECLRLCDRYVKGSQEPEET